MGVSQTAITKYEAGLAIPNSEAFLKMCAYLDESPYNFFHIEGSPTNPVNSVEMDLIKRVLFVIKYKWKNDQHNALISNINSFYGSAHDEYVATKQLPANVEYDQKDDLQQ